MCVLSCSGLCSLHDCLSKWHMKRGDGEKPNASCECDFQPVTAPALKMKHFKVTAGWLHSHLVNFCHPLPQNPAPSPDLPLLSSLYQKKGKWNEVIAFHATSCIIIMIMPIIAVQYLFHQRRRTDDPVSCWMIKSHITFHEYRQGIPPLPSFLEKLYHILQYR